MQKFNFELKGKMDDEGNDDKKTIKQAIDTVVNNFAKHAFAHGHGKGSFSSFNNLKYFLKKEDILLT